MLLKRKSRHKKEHPLSTSKDQLKTNSFKLQYEFEEKTEEDIICSCIEKYIEIANINSNTLDDYISIVAFIYTLKKQYPQYSKSFDKYLNIFKDKGIIEQYNKSTDNIAKAYFNSYENNVDKAEEIINGFIPNCSNRFFNFMIGIGICGKPSDAKRRHLLAQAYSWNSYLFASQSIYYTNLCLKYDQLNSFYLKQNADNYCKIRKFDIALDYLQMALKCSNNPYLFISISKVYHRKKDLDGAIQFFENEIQRVSNKEMKKVICNQLKILKNEKIGIKKHDFNGYNCVETIWDRNIEEKYIQLKQKYKSTFDEHIDRIDKISVIVIKGINPNNINALINLVLKDIENYYKIDNFYNELNHFGLINNYYYSDNYIKGYNLPKKICMSLEKANYINEAIKICQFAIHNNLSDDGTKSGMHGRLERLLKKQTKMFNSRNN